MVYSEAWGKLIHEKNLKSKISWHCPFKFNETFKDRIRQEVEELKKQISCHLVNIE
jgi:hypothetical protein